MLRSHTRRRHLPLPFRLILLLTLSVASTSSPLTWQAFAQQQSLPVTITITQFDWRNSPDDFLEGSPSFYAKVKIHGVEQRSSTIGPCDDVPFGTGCIYNSKISPFWVFTRNVDAALGTVDIELRIFDQDSAVNPDDEMDISPDMAAKQANISLDLTTGNWTINGVPNLTSSEGNGFDEAGQVYFDISTQSENGDADGDGLLDGWETRGFDADGDGTIDVNLPSFGANPRHKDLFLELDWMTGRQPTRAAIQAMKASFAAAPGDAAGIANPDNLPGINLWVDTGGLTDASGDRVGDNLGGGNEVGTRSICDLKHDSDNNHVADFYDAKRAAGNFNASRAWIFRYAIEAVPCVDDKGNQTSPGGQGELGGNDFVSYNRGDAVVANDGLIEAATLMHELGHNLNLHHGGNEDDNCKPNYVSIMNYSTAFGIFQAGGNLVIDYSPARTAAGRRGQAPLPNIAENNLSEPTILDTSDSNSFVFVNANGQQVRSPLNQAVDWNGDGDTNDVGPLQVDIDIQGTDRDGNPIAAREDCAGNTDIRDSTNPLKGHNDWANLSIAFRQFGDSADGPINPVIDPEPTTGQLLQSITALNTTDVGIAQNDTPDPAIAGDTLVYTLDVVNHGPNPASRVRLVDTLPTGVSHISNTAGCTESPARTLTCNLGELLAHQSRQIKITVNIAADLVHNAGGLTTITNNATVTNEAGPDSVSSNNRSSVQTQVIAQADLAIVRFGAVNPPPEILVGESVNITLQSVMTNNGPSAPMDVRVNMSATAPVGTSVRPILGSSEVLALGLGEQRALNETFTIQCSRPGRFTFTFTNVIQPLRTADTDPNQTNNQQTANIPVECVVPVAINIKPGSNPNSISLQGSAVSIAALTTATGEYSKPLAFNATKIDPLTVRFGPRNVVWSGSGGAAETHKTGHIENAVELNDTTKDTDMDMVLHFLPSQSGLVVGQMEACMKGSWTDASGNRFKFFGCDATRIVK